MAAATTRHSRGHPPRAAGGPLRRARRPDAGAHHDQLREAATRRRPMWRPLRSCRRRPFWSPRSATILTWLRVIDDGQKRLLPGHLRRRAERRQPLDTGAGTRLGDKSAWQVAGVKL